jgi:hypothetical protein
VSQAIIANALLERSKPWKLLQISQYIITSSSSTIYLSICYKCGDRKAGWSGAGEWRDAIGRYRRRPISDGVFEYGRYHSTWMSSGLTLFHHVGHDRLPTTPSKCLVHLAFRCGLRCPVHGAIGARRNATVSSHNAAIVWQSIIPAVLRRKIMTVRRIRLRKFAASASILGLKLTRIASSKALKNEYASSRPSRLILSQMSQISM